MPSEIGQSLWRLAGLKTRRQTPCRRGAARHGGDDERILALFVRDDDQRILVMASL